MQIYKIINKLNEKIYVGKDKHDNPNYYGSGLIIKQAIKKYGKDNFQKEVIETCLSEKEMEDREVFWINKLPCLCPIGYNISKLSWGGDNITHHPNKKEIIEKRRKALKGQKRSPEICEKMAIAQQKSRANLTKKEKKERAKNLTKSRLKRIKELGYTEKELTARKINAKRLSEFNKTPEARKRVSEQFKGKKKKPFTKKHRENIGKASKGRKIPGKPIFINNIRYESLHEASRVLNIPLMTIKNRLLNKNFPSYIYMNI
jgi:group I intron endonuclease